MATKFIIGLEFFNKTFIQFIKIVQNRLDMIFQCILLIFAWIAIRYFSMIRSWGMPKFFLINEYVTVVTKERSQLHHVTPSM